MIRERVTYAQNREDLILEAFFYGQKQGFYVDVGAYDPDMDSVTKRFYLRGWRGINIEPQVAQYEKFVKKRPRDTNLNIALSDKKGQLMLRKYENGGRSTLDETLMKDYEEKPSSGTEKYVDQTIEVDLLKNVLKNANVKKIDFLKVDVEGHEKNVLLGNDWKKYRPSVICIEADHITNDWHELLVTNRYEKIFFDGLNEYHVDQDIKAQLHFDYINFIVLRLKGGIHINDLEEIDRLQHRLRNYAQLVEGYQSHVDGLTAEVVELKNHIHEFNKSYIQKILQRFKKR